MRKAIGTVSSTHAKEAELKIQEQAQVKLAGQLQNSVAVLEGEVAEAAQAEARWQRERSAKVLYCCYTCNVGQRRACTVALTGVSEPACMSVNCCNVGQSTPSQQCDGLLP